MSWDWRGFYNSQFDARVRLTLLNYEYRTISRTFPGWTLKDIKGLTTRERRFWIALANWEHEMIKAKVPNA